MSQDIIDLFKVLAATLVVFAVSTLLMLYVILLLAQYGADLPMVGALPLTAPPELVPLLAESQVFATLGAVHVTATGLALVIDSRMIDSALLITAKAIAVVIVALIGFSIGHMVFLQFTENASLFLAPLTPAAVALAAFLVLASVMSLSNLRRLGNLRFLAAAVLVIVGPLLLVWL